MSEKKPLSIRIKPETREMIEEIAERRGQSIVVVIDRAVTLAYREMLDGKDSISAQPMTKPGRKKR